VNTNGNQKRYTSGHLAESNKVHQREISVTK